MDVVFVDSFSLLDRHMPEGRNTVDFKAALALRDTFVSKNQTYVKLFCQHISASATLGKLYICGFSDP
jgi:hypothetical protein